MHKVHDLLALSWNKLIGLAVDEGLQSVCYVRPEQDSLPLALLIGVMGSQAFHKVIPFLAANLPIWDEHFVWQGYESVPVTKLFEGVEKSGATWGTIGFDTYHRFFVVVGTPLVFTLLDGLQLLGVPRRELQPVQATHVKT